MRQSAAVIFFPFCIYVSKKVVFVNNELIFLIFFTPDLKKDIFREEEKSCVLKCKACFKGLPLFIAYYILYYIIYNLI